MSPGFEINAYDYEIITIIILDFSQRDEELIVLILLKLLKIGQDVNGLLFPIQNKGLIILF